MIRCIRRYFLYQCSVSFSLTTSAACVSYRPASFAEVARLRREKLEQDRKTQVQSDEQDKAQKEASDAAASKPKESIEMIEARQRAKLPIRDEVIPNDATDTMRLKSSVRFVVYPPNNPDAESDAAAAADDSTSGFKAISAEERQVALKLLHKFVPRKWIRVAHVQHRIPSTSRSTHLKNRPAGGWLRELGPSEFEMRLSAVDGHIVRAAATTTATEDDLNAAANNHRHLTSWITGDGRTKEEIRESQRLKIDEKDEKNENSAPEADAKLLKRQQNPHSPVIPIDEDQTHKKHPHLKAPRPSEAAGLSMTYDIVKVLKQMMGQKASVPVTNMMLSLSPRIKMHLKLNHASPDDPTGLETFLRKFGKIAQLKFVSAARNSGENVAEVVNLAAPQAPAGTSGKTKSTPKPSSTSTSSPIGQNIQFCSACQLSYHESMKVAHESSPAHEYNVLQEKLQTGKTLTREEVAKITAEKNRKRLKVDTGIDGQPLPGSPVLATDQKGNTVAFPVAPANVGVDKKKKKDDVNVDAAFPLTTPAGQADIKTVPTAERSACAARAPKFPAPPGPPNFPPPHHHGPPQPAPGAPSFHKMPPGPPPFQQPVVPQTPPIQKAVPQPPPPFQQVAHQQQTPARPSAQFSEPPPPSVRPAVPPPPRPSSPPTQPQEAQPAAAVPSPPTPPSTPTAGLPNIPQPASKPPPLSAPPLPSLNSAPPPKPRPAVNTAPPPLPNFPGGKAAPYPSGGMGMPAPPPLPPQQPPAQQRRVRLAPPGPPTTLQQKKTPPPMPNIAQVPKLPELPGQMNGKAPQHLRWKGVVGTAGRPDPTGATLEDQRRKQLEEQEERLMSGRTWRSPEEVVGCLMEHIPTFWIRIRHVESSIPYEIKELYTENQRLMGFVRRFSFYFDVKVGQSGPMLRAKPDSGHPKYGAGDSKYAESLRIEGEVGMKPAPDPSAPSPDIDTRSLVGRVRYQCPKTWMSVKDFQDSVYTDITNHPNYDSATGVLGVFEAHPEYFQLVGDKVRLRPKGTAPNALDSKNERTSPSPELFKKVYNLIPKVEGGGPAEQEKKDAMAGTMGPPITVAELQEALTVEEKKQIRTSHKSLSRFLRVHGKSVSVSPDNLTVRRFFEEEADEEESLLANTEERIAAQVRAAGIGGAAVDGPQLPDLTTIGADPVEAALREFYDALPLAQAAAVSDVLRTIQAPHIKGELMNQTTRLPSGEISYEPLKKLLEKFHGYFQVWDNPDKPGDLVVIRAEIPIEDFEDDEIRSQIHKLLPQGGLATDKLRRKLSLGLQRYLWKHGLVTTIKRFSSHFLVVDDLIMKIC